MEPSTVGYRRRPGLRKEGRQQHMDEAMREAKSDGNTRDDEIIRTIGHDKNRQLTNLTASSGNSEWELGDVELLLDFILVMNYLLDQSSCFVMWMTKDTYFLH